MADRACCARGGQLPRVDVIIGTNIPGRILIYRFLFQKEGWFHSTDPGSAAHVSCMDSSSVW